MFATDNRYILQIEDIRKDQASIRRNMTLLGNFYSKQIDFYNFVLSRVGEKERSLFDKSIGNLFSLFSGTTHGIIFDLYNAKQGYILNFEQFYKDYTALKNANDIEKINSLCKAFGEASQQCYRKNAEALMKIRADKDADIKYPAITNIMNEERNGQTIYSIIVANYRSYEALASEKNR